MVEDRIRNLLRQVVDGSLELESAVAALQGVDLLGHATLDTVRREICGLPEVVYGESKTAAQLVAIAEAYQRREEAVLLTRVDPAKAEALLAVWPEARHDADARTVCCPAPGPPTLRGSVGIVTAGTSDLPVAGEAKATLDYLGYQTVSFTDIGVAGLHRMLRQLERLREQDVLIVAAGMEGALPSVIAGQVACPVIAVPTSVGYGANFGGLAALLGMLTSCAAGVTVVNIDAGFSAACAAARILRIINPNSPA